MSKFVIKSDEARMLAKAHLEQCREFVKKAKEWRSNASWPDHIEGMWDYLKWARQEGERAKYWYKKLGLTFGTPALRSDEPPPCLALGHFHHQVRVAHRAVRVRQVQEIC